MQSQFSFYFSEPGLLRARSSELKLLRWSRLFAKAIFVPLLLGIVSSASAQDLSRGLQNYSDILAKKKKVDQLSLEELQEVILVFRRLINESSARRSKTPLSYESQEIQVSHKDKIFIINGNKWEARTSCFDFEKGDEVVFLAGRPLDACVSTELLNLRNDRVCRIWCRPHAGLLESQR